MNDQKNMLYGFLVLFLFSGACSFIYPDSIIPPLRRVVFFQKNFEKPNPFEFKINNGDPLLVLENEPLEINIKTIGKTDPEQVFLYSKKKRFFSEKTGSKSFRYIFNSVNKSFVFNLLDGNRDTVNYYVKVLPRPRMLKEKKIVRYPVYTQIANDTFYDLNRIIVPEGSTIDWEINCKVFPFVQLCLKTL